MDNTNNFAALRAATLGAQAIEAPQDNPLGATNAPEVANFYRSSFQLPAAQVSSGAADNVAANIVAEQKAAAARAEAAAKAKADPGKYKVVPRPDGGYGFYDPDGNEISASQYAQVAGKSIDQVLKDSTNPIDQAFASDYNQLFNYYQDKRDSKFDQASRDRAAATEKLVQQQYKINLSKQDPKQIFQTFMNAYPTVFGLHTTGPQGTNSFLPNDSALKLYQTNNSNNSIPKSR